MRSRQGQDNIRLPRSNHRGTWVDFDVLDEHILPHVKHCHETEAALLSAQHATVNDDDDETK